MPVGAIVGATAVSAGTSLISSGRQSRAATQAADTQAQAADRSAEVQREIYYDQANRLEPFRGLGLSAINPMAQLMGLDYQYQSQPQGRQVYQPANDSGLAAISGLRFGGGAGGQRTAEAFFTGNPQRFVNQGQTQGLAGLGVPQNTPQNRPQSPTDSLTALQNRPGYQFRLQQGNDAYEASAAARGLGNSGAQLRALARYNQDYASNEYDKEFNRLNALMGGGQVATNNINQAAGAYGVNAGNALMNAGNARASGYIGSANAQAAGLNGATNAILGGVGAYGGLRGWFGT